MTWNLGFEQEVTEETEGKYLVMVSGPYEYHGRFGYFDYFHHCTTLLVDVNPGISEQEVTEETEGKYLIMVSGPYECHGRFGYFDYFHHWHDVAR